MPEFSQTSLDRLNTCDPQLIKLFEEVIKYFDCTILCGFRNQADQHEAFITGKSKLDWPNGNHNKNPSYAVDVAPYPVDWDDYKRLYFFAGFVKATAKQMGIPIRWGGDWNDDTQVKDNTFNDLVHFELVPQ